MGSSESSFDQVPLTGSKDVLEFLTGQSGAFIEKETKVLRRIIFNGTRDGKH